MTSELDIIYVTKETLERYKQCLPEHIIPPEIEPPYFAFQYRYRGTLILALDGTPPKYKGGGNRPMEAIEAEFYEFMEGRV